MPLLSPAVHTTNKKYDDVSVPQVQCAKERRKPLSPIQNNIRNISFFVKDRNCEDPFNHESPPSHIFVPNLVKRIQVLVTCPRAHTFLVARRRRLCTFKPTSKCNLETKSSKIVPPFRYPPRHTSAKYKSIYELCQSIALVLRPSNEEELTPPPLVVPIGI